MRKRQMFTLLTTAFFLVFVALVAHEPRAQAGHAPVVETMTITGEIAKGYKDRGYVIRGKVPSEIFTILNPEPKILDEFVKTGKTVHLEVRIVTGDNVEIEIIDGKEYRQGAQ